MVNQVQPIGDDSEMKHNGKKCKCESVTLNEVLRIKMDVAASTPLGGHLPNGLLEIFVSPKELYCVDKGVNKIIKTTTEVGYVHTDAVSSKARLLLGLHYDYDVKLNGEPEPGHPTYHVQITNKLITLTGFFAGLDIDVASCSNVPFLRVPTAHMSLTSILLGIAADCFKSEDFKAFIDSVRKKPALSLFPPDNLFQRIQKNANSLASCSWYCS